MQIAIYKIINYHLNCFASKTKFVFNFLKLDTANNKNIFDKRKSNESWNNLLTLMT